MLKSSVTSGSDKFKDGKIFVTRERGGLEKEYELHYRIHNPMNLSSQQAAPLVVLHGGPGVPSDYLYPLRDVIPYRSIIFFDQLGSGRSPVDACEDDLCLYSIDLAINDLEHLLKKLGVRKFHLYGQSFGGILGFEFMKRIAEGSSIYHDRPDCLCAVLSSVPTDVQQVEGVADDLVSILLDEDNNESTVGERFRLRHQCRTPEKPQPLVDAYNHAGTLWRGTTSIPDWKAIKPSDDASRMPSTMILRGEYDFVSDDCVKEWKEVYNHPFVRYKVLEGCSHHGLLEDSKSYGTLVQSYISEYD
jgi:pimeloyl-ACP methyl ester carboxylesterase